MTYYEILEVVPHASQEVIKNAYRALAKKYHPDIQSDENNKQRSESAFKAITEAYEVLADIERRKEYDIWLNNTEVNIMTSYCKKCLTRVPDGEQLCPECISMQTEKGTTETIIDFVSDKVKKMNENRKYCIKCGQQINIILSAVVKKENALCIDCIKKEEQEKKQRAIDERIEKMKTGMSFLHINRVAQLANGLMKMKIRLFNVENKENVEAVLINGDSIEVDVEAHKRYSIVAKITGWKESKALTIDIGRGETVYIEITSKSAGNPYQLVFRTLSGEEMVFCKIVKREFIENDKVTVMKAAF